MFDFTVVHNATRLRAVAATTITLTLQPCVAALDVVRSPSRSKRLGGEGGGEGGRRGVGEEGRGRVGGRSEGAGRGRVEEGRGRVGGRWGGGEEGRGRVHFPSLCCLYLLASCLESREDRSRLWRRHRCPLLYRTASSEPRIALAQISHYRPVGRLKFTYRWECEAR